MTSPRRLSHRQALLALLSDCRWHGMRECLEVGGYRYGARIFSLRKEGFDIETRHVFGDVYEYKWNRRPKQMELL